MTMAGKVFLVCTAFVLLVSYWLAKRMLRRQHKNATDVPRLAVTFWTIVIAIMCSSAVPLAAWVIGEARLFIFSDASKGTVVAYIREEDTCEYKDRRGQTREYACTKYTPTYSAILKDGTRRILSGDIRSTTPPVLGDTVTVMYQPRSQIFYERSARSIGMFCGAILMDVILFYLLGLIAAYGAGYDIRRAVATGMRWSIRVLVPLAALGMEAAMLSVPLRVLRGDTTFPLWMTFLCSGLALALLPLLWLFAKALFGWFAGLGRSGSSQMPRPPASR
jgi:hypothetical protein